MEPDIAHYTVYVRNVNTSRTAAINVTRPEFAFTGLPGEVPDPFTLYEFHISAWNVVGEGEKSGPVQASFLNRGLMRVFFCECTSLNPIPRSVLTWDSQAGNETYHTVG